jgi:hypothetical protein
MFSCLLIAAGTATSRTKDVLYAVAFPYKGGEIYFLRSKFWTDCVSRGSVRRAWLVREHIFRHCKDAALPIELNPLCGVGRNLDFTGFGTNAGDRMADRSALPKLGQ